MGIKLTLGTTIHNNTHSIFFNVNYIEIVLVACVQCMSEDGIIQVNLFMCILMVASR